MAASGTSPAVSERPASLSSPAAHGRPLHWESWLLRVALAAAAGFALARGNAGGGAAALLALAASFAPPVVGRASGSHIPWTLDLVVTFALFATGVSEALGLYGRWLYWGKVLHGAEGCLVTLTFGLLFFAYRDRARLGLSDPMVAFTTILGGFVFAMSWEILEFFLDWARYSDIQKSNADTMTDMLWTDLGVAIAAVLAAHAYAHWTTRRQRAELGAASEWMVEGPSRVLTRHGGWVLIGVVLLFAVLVGALWIAGGRTIPGWPTG